MQATSLPFIVASTVIGRELGLRDGAESAALIAAGPLLVLAFPLAGLRSCAAPTAARQRPMASRRR